MSLNTSAVFCKLNIHYALTLCYTDRANFSKKQTMKGLHALTIS